MRVLLVEDSPRLQEFLEAGLRKLGIAVDVAGDGERGLREYALLEYLAQQAGAVVSRHKIEDHLYGERDFPMSNAVDRIVCTLRKKLDSGGAVRLLHTRRGFGYVLGAQS